MHDDQQVVRLQQLDKSLRAGQFPVRWVEDLGFGYGYPLFNFYPPLVYYLGELGVFSGLGYINSIKVVWFVALAGSGLAMYFLGKEFFGKVGGFVSVAFYLYAPYHAVDAYVRGALAELFSFVWLPLILLFSYKTVKTGRIKYALFAGLLLGLLMVTHNLIFLPFAGILAVWYLLIMVIHGKREKTGAHIIHGLLMILVAFGLTAFFWLPSLVEKKFTLVDQLLIKNLASYKIHFVCPAQLWYSQWGFGGSVAGCADGVSFALGKVYFLAIISGFLISLMKKSAAGLVSFVLLLFSLFMTLPYSQFIWDLIPPLWYLQFPWRFLEFAALFSALLAGSVWLIIPRRLQIIAALGIIALLIFVDGKYFRPQQYLANATDAQQTSDERIKWDISSSSFEYLPAGIATKFNDLGVLWVDINKYQISNIKYLISNGTVVERRFNPDNFYLAGNFKENSELRVNVTNFPGWRVFVDGKETKFRDDNKYKLITVDVPAGNHNVSGQFTNTLVRTIGNLVSVAFILGTIVAIGIYGLRRSKNPSFHSGTLRAVLATLRSGLKT